MMKTVFENRTLTRSRLLESHRQLFDASPQLLGVAFRASQTWPYTTFGSNSFSFSQFICPIFSKTKLFIY